MKGPVVGQDVYIGTSLYLDHGADDFQGGLCKVDSVEKKRTSGKEVPFVTVEERSGWEYNWEYLMENQEKWAARYGNRRGYCDPDYREEFNEHW